MVHPPSLLRYGAAGPDLCLLSFLIFASLKLARLPACLLLPSSLYLLCRASRALHSSYFLRDRSIPGAAELRPSEAPTGFTEFVSAQS